MAKYRIAYLPGDGVGNDVMEAASMILEELKLDAEFIHGDDPGLKTHATESYGIDPYPGWKGQPEIPFGIGDRALSGGRDDPIGFGQETG